MKKSLIACCLFSCFLLLAACSPGYVTTRPADVVYARPVSPGPDYVWISGEWEWRGGDYHWREGSWQRAKEGHNWKSGHWENGQKGYRWQKGHWEQ
jgi:hypothetical protein